MIMTDVTDFVLTDSYFHALKAYYNVADEQKYSRSYLQQHIPTALEKLQLGKDQPRFNILSIGAGDGFMDQQILKIVQEGHLNAKEEVEILNTAVEPNIEFLGKYKESIERQSGKASSKERSVQFDLKQMTFQEYAESKHDHNQYDMVHAIHSLYYVEMESALKHIYDSELGEKGLIACLLGNDSDLPIATMTILEKLRSKCHRKNWFGKNPAADLIQLVEKNSMKYDQVTVPFSVDVTNVFDERSEEGRHLLAFFSHEINYRQTADPNELKEVLKMLEDISSKDDNGRLIVNCTLELVLIYKTP